MNKFKSAKYNFSKQELQAARDIGATHYIRYHGTDTLHYYRFVNHVCEQYSAYGCWKCSDMSKYSYGYLLIIPYPECRKEIFTPVSNTLPDVLKSMTKNRKMYYNSDGTEKYQFVKNKNYFRTIKADGSIDDKVYFDIDKWYEKTVTYSVRGFDCKNIILSKLIDKNGSVSKGLEDYLNNPNLNIDETIQFAREVLGYNII